MKKTVKISIIIMLLTGIIILSNLNNNIKKEKNNLNKELQTVKLNNEKIKNEEKLYNELNKKIEILKEETKKTKEKYDEVNSWNQEIKSYLD